MAIQSVTVNSGFSTVYSSTGNNAITVMYLCNITPNVVTFNLYAVADGSNPGDHNVMYYNVPIQGRDTYVIDTEKLILASDDMLVVSASDINAIVVTTSSMDL